MPSDRDAKMWFDNYSSDAHERALDKILADLEALPEPEQPEPFDPLTGPATTYIVDEMP